MKKRVVSMICALFILTGCFSISKEEHYYRLSEEEVTIDIYSKSFDPKDYLLIDGKEASEKEKKNIKVVNKVNLNKVGNYKVSFPDYLLEMQVNVVDCEPPTLSIKDVTLEMNSKFDINNLEVNMKDNVTNVEKLKETFVCEQIDTSVERKVEATCSIEDESGNKTSSQFTINVIKGKTNVSNNKPSNSSSNNNSSNSKPSNSNGNNNSSGSKPSTSNPNNSSSDKPVLSNDEMAYKVFLLVNEEREKVGVLPLKYSTDNLSLATKKRAEEIIVSFSHTRPNQESCFTVLDDYNIVYFTAGENIAAGYRTPEEVMRGWMNSQGHKANILNPSYTTIAVAVKDYHWVQIFIG